MAMIESWFNQDLKEPVKVRYLGGNVFSADNAGNLIGVNVFSDGHPATLGGSVAASVIRADGATVAVPGALSGNQATVVLNQSCYAVPGPISIVIKITQSGAVTTICAIVANVYRSSTDSVVDPGTIIPSIDTLIAEIEAAVASIPADYSDLWTSLAPAYSNSSTYKVGKYVTYNGGLYRCITAITSAESWTAAHWASAKLGPDIAELRNDLAIGLDREFGIFRSSNISYTVEANTSSFNRWLFEVSLSPGDYEISCIQDVTLASASRNRFYYEFNGSNTYEPSDMLSAGLHTWKFTISTAGTYKFAIWVATPSADVTISDFVLVRYSLPEIVQMTSILNSIKNLHRNVCFVDNAVPTFEKSGNSIVVTFPADKSVSVTYTKNDGTNRSNYYFTNSQQSITVPSDGILVYDIKSTQFVVVGDNGSFADKDAVICFMNYKGEMYGQWKRYTFQSEIDALKNALPNALPAYYDSYLPGKIDAINTNLMEAPQGDSFVFISDIHISGNAMNSPGLIKNIIDKTSIDKIILNGDYIQQESTKALALRRINDVVSRYKFANAQTFIVEGNHEYNTNGTITPAPELTWQELYYPIIKDIENKVVRQSNGLGYYWLNEAQKIKYMVATYNEASGMDFASCKFIIQNLTNTPAGYTIVFMNHGGINTNGTYQSGMDQIIAALDAVRNKTTYTFDGVTYDFTDATYTAACVIVGHQHQDYSATSASGMPLIVVTTDAFLYDESQTTRTEGTTSEQAFDVFTINTVAKTIKAVRIGAGSNRSFSYGGV